MSKAEELGHVLVVDDEENIRRILEASLNKQGWEVSTCADGHEATEWLHTRSADVILSDVTMPRKDGFALFNEVKATWPTTPFVFMTAFGTIPQAVQAIREGAFEYIPKPFDLKAVHRLLQKAVREAEKGPQKPTTASAPKSEVIIQSPAMQEVYELAGQAAQSKATVLITGESGTGKEVLAKYLHQASPRSAAPFVAVNCAAIPDSLLESELFGYERGAFTGADQPKAGKFEAAHGGTLFLDEIGEIPHTTQVKLLRVLQEREVERLGSNLPTAVDVRLIAATNQDLHKLVDDGAFRLDLLYRLQVIDLYLPPLRERVEEIIPLAEAFKSRFNLENEKEVVGFDPEVKQALLSYQWPGNIRELENTVERAVVLCPEGQALIKLAQLPASLRRAA